MGNLFTRKVLVVIVTIVVIMTITGGIGVFAQEKKPLIIGSINPLTGTGAPGGINAKRGIDLAVDEINACGGVLGRPLKIIHEDDETRPQAAMDAIHKLININKVSLVMGTWASGCTVAAATYANKVGVPYINTIGTTQTVREIGPWVFSIIPDNIGMGRSTAEFAMKDSGQKVFSILTVNNEYGISLAKAMRKTVEEAGGKILDEVRYDSGKSNYRAELQRLVSHNPPHVLYSAYPQDSPIINKQAYELGIEPGLDKWYATFLMMCTMKSPAETIEGMKGVVPGGAGTATAVTERAKYFQEKFKEKYGFYSERAWAIYTYDAIWVAAIAINFAGSTEPEAIKKALPTAFRIYRGASAGGAKVVDEDGMQVYANFPTLIYHDGKYLPYEY